MKCAVSLLILSSLCITSLSGDGIPNPYNSFGNWQNGNGINQNDGWSNGYVPPASGANAAAGAALGVGLNAGAALGAGLNAGAAVGAGLNAGLAVGADVNAALGAGLNAGLGLGADVNAGLSLGADVNAGLSLGAAAIADATASAAATANVKAEASAKAEADATANAKAEASAEASAKAKAEATAKAKAISAAQADATANALADAYSTALVATKTVADKDATKDIYVLDSPYRYPYPYFDQYPLYSLGSYYEEPQDIAFCFYQTPFNGYSYRAENVFDVPVYDDYTYGLDYYGGYPAARRIVKYNSVLLPQLRRRGYKVVRAQYPCRYAFRQTYFYEPYIYVCPRCNLNYLTGDVCSGYRSGALGPALLDARPGVFDTPNLVQGPTDYVNTVAYKPESVLVPAKHLILRKADIIAKTEADATADAAAKLGLTAGANAAAKVAADAKVGLGAIV